MPKKQINDYFKLLQIKRKNRLNSFLSFSIYQKMKGKVAVIGALTNFGRSLLDYLADNGWPITDVFALDRIEPKSVQIPYHHDFLDVLSMDTFDFHRVRICFLCLSAFLSDDREAILKSGAYLIDCVGILENASCIIASLNIKKSRKSRLILNPTALTIALTKILSPIHNYMPITDAQATVLLSAGLFGLSAVQDLVNQSRCLYTREEPEIHLFSKIQAFNLIPEISPALNRKTADQIKSLLHFPIVVSSCLTPVFQGECYSLTFTTKSKTSLKEIRKVLEQSCQFDDSFAPDLGLSTQDILFANSLYVSRLSTVPFRPNTFHLWILCDSLRTGSIPNAVQIAQYLL